MKHICGNVADYYFQALLISGGFYMSVWCTLNSFYNVLSLTDQYRWKLGDELWYANNINLWWPSPMIHSRISKSLLAELQTVFTFITFDYILFFALLSYRHTGDFSFFFCSVGHFCNCNYLYQIRIHTNNGKAIHVSSSLFSIRYLTIFPLDMRPDIRLMRCVIVGSRKLKPTRAAENSCWQNSPFASIFAKHRLYLNYMKDLQTQR